MAFSCKFILVLIAAFALLQFVEMARVARDVEAAGQPGSPGDNVDLKGAIDAIMEKFKGLVDEDKFKEIVRSASDAIAEGAKKLKESLD